MGLSSRPPRTKLSHTGQCSSPRPSRVLMLENSSQTLDPPDQLLLLDQPPLVVPPLLRNQRKRRKKKPKMLIWEVFSEMRMTTEIIRQPKAYTSRRMIL